LRFERSPLQHRLTWVGLNANQQQRFGTSQLHDDHFGLDLIVSERDILQANAIGDGKAFACPQAALRLCVPGIVPA